MPKTIMLIHGAWLTPAAWQPFKLGMKVSATFVWRRLGLTMNGQCRS